MAYAAAQNLQEHFVAMARPYVFAVNFQSLLCGIIILLQAYDYFLMYRNDSWRMKTLVAFLVSLNLVGCAADIYILWWQLILYFGNYNQEFSAPQETEVSLFLGPFVAAAAQMFFARRCYSVSKSIPQTLLMGSLILLGFVGGLGTAISAAVGEHGTIGAFLQEIEIWVLINGWGNAVCDLVISTSMAIQLSRSKKGFSTATDHVLSRLVKMTVGTAALTTLCAAANGLAYLINHDTSTAYIIFNFMLPRTYTLCVLYTLNARRSLRFAVGEGDTSDDDPSGTRKTRPGAAGISVHLQTFVAEERDEETPAPTEKRTQLRFDV